MYKLYTTQVLAKGGRNGHVKSSDGLFEVEFRKPKEMGGVGSAANPEQLFAAAWGACYLGALSSVAQLEGIDASAANVTIEVSINQNRKSFKLSAKLDVHVPNTPKFEAQKLAEKAHKLCLYSKATRKNIDVQITAI
jgi:osmotically inducible protein OsmC